MKNHSSSEAAIFLVFGSSTNEIPSVSIPPIKSIIIGIVKIPRTGNVNVNITTTPMATENNEMGMNLSSNSKTDNLTTLAGLCRVIP